MLQPVSSALDALRRVLELGVPVKHLALPMDIHEPDDDRSSPSWREAYVKFARAICGYGRNAATTRLGGVEKLTIYAGDMENPDMELLCSALQHARGVRHVETDWQGQVDDDQAMEGFPLSVWPLLALSLLSRDSTTSVEALTVRGVPIDDEDTIPIGDAVGSAYPLHLYATQWVSNARPSRPASRVPRKVSIPAGTTLTSHYGHVYSIVTDEETEAFDYFEDDGVTHVLIVGRGCCQVATSVLPVKRARSTRLRRVDGQDTSSLLKSLEFSTNDRDATSRAHLKTFIELVGGKTLQRLRLKVPNLTDDDLSGVLAVCPNLEFLAVTAEAFQSMTPFEMARASGLRLRSLEVARIRVPEPAMNDYLATALRRFSSHQDDDGVLLNLRLGQVSDGVLAQLESVVENSPIRYLDYTIVKPLQSIYARLAKQQHGKVTGDVRDPLAAASVMAFLGSVRCHATTKSAFCLTDEIKELIVTYASTPYTRTVLCREVDEEFD